jgi:hypothetical protein
MSAVLERVDPMVELSRAHAVLDALAELDLSGLSEAQLLDYGRGKQRLRRRRRVRTTPSSARSRVAVCRRLSVCGSWRSRRLDPARWVDPDQQPRYNHLNDAGPPPHLA